MLRITVVTGVLARCVMLRVTVVTRVSALSRVLPGRAAGARPPGAAGRRRPRRLRVLVRVRNAHPGPLVDPPPRQEVEDFVTS